MVIEIRNLGVTDNPTLEEDSRRVLGDALDRFEEGVIRVRVRFIPAGGHDATCRARVWCGSGPSFVVEEEARSSGEAVHAVADVLVRALRRRSAGRRARRRHATAYSPLTQEEVS